MNPQLQQVIGDTLQYVEVSSRLAKVACDELKIHKQAQKKAADLRSPLLEHMISAGVVSAKTKEAAEAMLGSHAETMQLLKAAVDKLVEARRANGAKTATDQGQAVDEKTAGVGDASATTNGQPYNSLTSPYVGQRTSFKKASDMELAKIQSAPGT